MKKYIITALSGFIAFEVIGLVKLFNTPLLDYSGLPFLIMALGSVWWGAWMIYGIKKEFKRIWN